MKLLRVGEKGQEKVAAIDSDNLIRDLSQHLKDLDPNILNEDTLNKLTQIELYHHNLILVFYLSLLIIEVGLLNKWKI